MEPFTAVMFTLLLWFSRTKGEIRCYCNDASCVSTSYMCKSPSGKCFSEIPPEGDTLATSARGCVESLPVLDRTVCTEQDDMIKTHNGADKLPILICCREDMCNYQDMVDINIYVNTKSNGSILKGKHHSRGTNYNRDNTEYRYVDDRYQQRDLWFKAAVIAVPIAGGFILILLVLLAVRMLRNDSRRHRQLMHMRGRHRSLAKAQLYVADHFCEKNERHAHYNCIDHNSKPNNNQVYKDVNIKVDYDGGHGGYEKMRDSSSPHAGSRNSIIVWGKPGKAEPANVV